MAGPRVSGPKLLRQIARQPATQFRALHMTGRATAPRMPTTDKPLQPSLESTSAPSTQAPRTFNTSRELKANKDSSTMDFTYLPTFKMPDLEQDIESQAPTWQIPILPSATHRYDASTSSPHGMSVLRARRDAETTAPESVDASTTEPVINTIACESTHIHAPSAMSDVHDGAQHHSTDFHDVVDTLSSGSSRIGETVDAVRDAAKKVVIGVEREGTEELKQGKGLFKQVWMGLLEDLRGDGKVGVSKG